MFCNQIDITGYSFQADEEKVLGVLKTYLEPSFKSKTLCFYFCSDLQDELIIFKIFIIVFYIQTANNI